MVGVVACVEVSDPYPPPVAGIADLRKRSIELGAFSIPVPELSRRRRIARVLRLGCGARIDEAHRMAVLVGVDPLLLEIGLGEFGRCRTRYPEAAADEIMAFVPGMPGCAVVRHLQDPPAARRGNAQSTGGRDAAKQRLGGDPISDAGDGKSLAPR
jgi:hypothetical protein